MRERPAATYRRLAVAMLDAADASEADPQAGAGALGRALGMAGGEVDPQAALGAAAAVVFLVALAYECSARDALDGLYRACDS